MRTAYRHAAQANRSAVRATRKGHTVCDGRQFFEDVEVCDEKDGNHGVVIADCRRIIERLCILDITCDRIPRLTR